MSGKHGMMRRTHELNRGIGEVVVPEGLTDVAIEEAGQKALRTELDNDVLENHGALPVELVRGLGHRLGAACLLCFAAQPQTVRAHGQ